MTFQNPELQKHVENSIYIRSMDHLTILDETKKQNTECQFTYSEVIELFGFSKIEEIIDYGCAIIISSVIEPATSIIIKMNQRNISVSELISLSGVSEDIFNNFVSYKRVNFSDVIKICKVLDVDYRTVGTK
jgi:hypothetical protein